MDLNKSSQFTFAPNSTNTSTGGGFFNKPTTGNTSFTFGQTGTTGTTSGTPGTTTNLFGGTTNPTTTTTTPFGGSTGTTSGTGFFATGTNPTTTTTSGTGFFGNKPNPTTTTSGGGLFGSTSTFPTTTTTSTTGFFNQPSTTTGGFNPLGHPQSTILSMPPQHSQHANPYANVFTISSTNMMKYEKVETFPEELKKHVVAIEQEINNNDILGDQTSQTISDLFKEFFLIKREGQKMFFCLKLIYTKHQKISYVIEGLKNDVKVQNEFLEQNIKNFNILNNYPEMKISVPSEYFIKLAKEFEDKMSKFKKELAELESIIELTYQNEMEEDNEENSDLVEKFIQEIYTSLRYFITECVSLNEKTKIIKNAFYNYMKINYNVKESDLDFRYKEYLEKNFKGNFKN